MGNSNVKVSVGDFGFTLKFVFGGWAPQVRILRVGIHRSFCVDSMSFIIVLGRGKELQLSENSRVPVTVLMPVRNGAQWIHPAIDSLLNQDYENFEILLVDDGSVDDSVSIAKDLAGDNLRVVTAPGQGLARALAIGVGAADTEIVLRLDADDKAAPKRLSKQVTFLNDNPEFVLVGANVNIIDARDSRVGGSRFPLTDRGIRLRMNIGNPFAHSAVAFRRSAVLAAGNYWSPDAKPFPEDYHLWCRVALTGLMANLPERLVDYHLHQSGLALANKEIMRSHTSEISWEWFSSQGYQEAIDPKLQESWHACFGSNLRISFQESLAVTRALIHARASNPQDFNDHGLRLMHFMIPLTRMWR